MAIGTVVVDDDVPAMFVEEDEDELLVLVAMEAERVDGRCICPVDGIGNSYASMLDARDQGSVWLCELCVGNRWATLQQYKMIVAYLVGRSNNLSFSTCSKHTVIIAGTDTTLRNTLTC